MTDRVKHAPGDEGPVCGATPFRFPDDIAVTTDQVVTCPACQVEVKYMTRQELYREACAPRSTISEEFVQSLRFRIIQDDPEQWDEERETATCQPWCVALRTAIREAWDSYTEAEYHLTQESARARMERSIGYAHGQRYTAMKVIRNIAREMYRHTVPHEERIL